MDSKPIKVLLVDDDEEDYILTRSLFKEIRSPKFTIDWVSNFDNAIECFNCRGYDIYLIDYRLGVNTGIDLLKKAIELGCKEPIIMLTGKGDQKIDVEAMEAGAADYLVKDKIDSFVLERAIRYAIERSQALDAIKESETKYRSIFEQSRDVIYITDVFGNFMDLNDSAVKLFGYSKEELLALNMKGLFFDDEERFRFDQILNTKGEIADMEVTLTNKNDEKVYCLINATLQPGRLGSPDLYQGIIHDITKRKMAEQKLMSSEKLAVTGRIARSIAHEVRNPLTNVFLSLEQLKNEVNDEEFDKDNLTMYFDIINRNCERINFLITELLNSSKPIQLSVARYPINKILDESLDLAIDRIRLKKIKVTKYYLAGAEDTILIDPEKIKIAFVNIIINAVEALEPEKGHITLTTETKDNKCIVYITDNGPGIPPENLSRLFEPFFSSKSKGVGLGLTSTQNIILNHKGSIDVESEVGHGTTFIISFNIDNQ